MSAASEIASSSSDVTDLSSLSFAIRHVRICHAFPKDVQRQINGLAINCEAREMRRAELGQSAW